MSLSRPLLARLHHDLAELLEAPYPGVDVFTDDANIQKFCLVLTPPSGPWKDLSLHFDVVLPDNWPSSPPKVSSSVSGIKHPNLFGQWICCDLLKEQSQLMDGYTGGYTPALTLRGLFLQFLTFFSSTSVEQDYGGSIYIGDHYLVSYAAERDEDDLEKLWNSSVSPEVEENTTVGNTTHTTKQIAVRLRRYQRLNPRWESTHKLISQWRCKACPYGSDAFPVHCVAQGDEMESNLCTSSLPIPPSACILGMLNDDVLLHLATYLPSESLISFSKAYARFHVLTTTAHILLQRELRCFFLRTPLQDSVLGIGVTFEPKSRRLSSDFDWLSKEAFSKHGVRKSIEKREFGFFLPLAFSRPHFTQAHAEIWDHLWVLDQAVRDIEGEANKKTGRTSARQTAPPTQAHQAVRVVFRMMNNIVVSLMKSCDDALGSRRVIARPSLLHASEKAVISYCHLFHLLLCLCRTTPLVLREATARLQRFIQTPASRTKTQVPDLGELIILVTLVLALPPVISKPVSWAQLNGPFLEEAIVRNVRWVLKDAPELEVMEAGPNDYRLQKTFEKSRTSLRLIMFQITFLDIFIKTYAGNISQLDNNYGFPESGLPERMVEEIKSIYNVKTWPGFFHRVQYARGLEFGKERFSELLRTAVRTSGQRGYHTPRSGGQLGDLSLSRKSLEKKWMQART